MAKKFIDGHAYAEMVAREEGLEKGKKMPFNVITEVTGLSKKEILSQAKK